MLVKKLRREKGKHNINSRKYGQVKLRASRRGISSCLFALACLICLFVLIYVAYITYGEAPTLVGSIGFVAVVNAVTGIYYGAMGFRERERSYAVCKIGITCNAIVIALFLSLLIRGLF